ncbi:MAG: NAD(P)H-dependent oxidoreductase [Sinimarinibacterium sp.]
MSRRITIIQGHPDARSGHFCHALADAYSAGATQAGHEVRRVDVAALDFPLLTRKDDWEKGETPPSLREAQEAILWAQHLVLLYPLWLGTLPAQFKGFLEQVLRPSLIGGAEQGLVAFGKLLKGRSARIVVTMGMPALLYRWYFRAHSLKNLQRNILGFVGVAPIRSSVIGLIETRGKGVHERWLANMRDLGKDAR